MGERVRQADRERQTSRGDAIAPYASDLADTAWRLQATAGNRSTVAFFANAQAKLTVGAVDDPLEIAADRAAEVAVRLLGSSPPPDEIAADDREDIEYGAVARRRPLDAPSADAGGPVDADTERTIQAAKTGGAPLRPDIRRSMETAFAADLGSVRVHSGPASNALNDKLQAKAFTVGTDIFFNGGVPDTSSPSGQYLLAHELAHTVQQGAVAPVIRRKKKKKRGGQQGTGGQKTGPPKQTAPTKKRTDEELLTGPLPPVGDPQYQRAIKLRMQAGNKRRSEEQSSGGILGTLWSWLPGSVSYSAPTDEVEDDDGGGIGYGSSELAKGEGGGSVAEVEFGDQEPEAEPEDLKNPLGLSEIEIELGAGSLEKKDTRVGDVTAKGGIKGTGSGDLKMEGSGSVEGSKGKASAEMKLLRDANGMEGEGKVEFVLGATGEKKSGTLAWDILGLRLEGDGALEGFGGAKGGVEGKGKYDTSTGEFSGKGKLGGMVGMGTEGTVRVKLKTGDSNLGTVEGKLGLQYGVGGEIFGTIEFKGGTLTFSSGGKLSAGIGGSFSYKVELNTQALVDVSASWLSSLWTWMTDTDGMTEEDFWL